MLSLHVIDQAVDHIRDGSIIHMHYDPAAAMLVNNRGKD